MIGVDVDDFRLEAKESLRTAARLEFEAVEIGAVRGDLAAWNLSSSGRRHLTRFVAGLGLNLSALRADMPRLRFTDRSAVDERVERTMQVVQLAADLNVPTVTASVGAMTDPQTGEPLPDVLEALSRVGEFADSRGCVFALRPSLDVGDRLVAVLRALDCSALKVCLDPAAAVMSGCNPMASFDTLAERIALVHARDATVGSAEHPGQEVPLGEGEVDLPGVLAALDSADYREPYILRRANVPSAAAAATDLLHARKTLTRMLPKA